MSGLHAANLGLRFLLELAAWAAWTMAGVVLGGWWLGAVLFVVVPVAWGLFVSPKARWRIAPVRHAVEVVVFLGAPAGLCWLGRAWWAGAMLSLVLIHWMLAAWHRRKHDSFTT